MECDAAMYTKWKSLMESDIIFSSPWSCDLMSWLMLDDAMTGIASNQMGKLLSQRTHTHSHTSNWRANIFISYHEANINSIIIFASLSSDAPSAPDYARGKMWIQILSSRRRRKMENFSIDIKTNFSVISLYLLYIQFVFFYILLSDLI